MNNSAAIILTTAATERLREELDTLLARRRAAVLEYTIQRDSADGAALSTTSPPAIAELERRIAELQALLDEAEAYSGVPSAPGVVGLGSQVTVRWDDGDEERYTIVGPLESDPRRNRIAADSPVGRALRGRAVGDRVTIATPGGNSVLGVVDVA